MDIQLGIEIIIFSVIGMIEEWSCWLIFPLFIYHCAAAFFIIIYC